MQRITITLEEDDLRSVISALQHAADVYGGQSNRMYLDMVAIRANIRDQFLEQAHNPTAQSVGLEITSTASLEPNQYTCNRGHVITCDICNDSGACAECGLIEGCHLTVCSLDYCAECGLNARDGHHTGCSLDPAK